MKTRPLMRRPAGFSLIELLLVILIIGILAAIAVPSIGSLTGATDTVKDKRNAQTLLLAYTTGLAAGVVWPEGDVATQVAGVVAGQKPTSGAMKDITFHAVIGADNIVGLYPYLGVRTDGSLFFDAAGGQSATGH